ncbi:hypothetical protein B0T25DRAFT_345284 [Lasiosphaeria hispida]|uniref:Uncharacterized protein n=1 Tax=Lasiosphaeria hispida TaxID=260671 RepID=A0AAJ0M8E6_9PEZI|nr:hypothetical protein B0T25DRAFT_345284 [Lasiosphaeria hispida]
MLRSRFLGVCSDAMAMCWAKCVVHRPGEAGGVREGGAGTDYNRHPQQTDGLAFYSGTTRGLREQVCPFQASFGCSLTPQADGNGVQRPRGGIRKRADRANVGGRARNGQREGI